MPKRGLSQRVQAAILPLWNMLPNGILIIGRSGKVLATNRAGRHALDHGGVIGESGGVVALSAESEDEMLRALIRYAREGDRSVSALRVPWRSFKPLLILFVPIGEGRTHSPEDPLALLILNGAPHKPNSTLLMEFFGFTPAESKVASLLMQGKTVDDVASALGTTENTTRNHLKHMYSKTMTRRQGELVHTLLSSPVALMVSEAQEEEPAQPEQLHRTRSA